MAKRRHRGAGLVVMAAVCLPAALARAGNQFTLTVGDGDTCFADKGGRLFCAGRNEHGQIGDGMTADVFFPKQVGGLVQMAAAGDNNICYILAGIQNVYCSGANQFGQIGDGTTTERHGFVAASGGLLGGYWLSVGNTTCRANANGVRGVACWGSNHLGAVGDGTTTDRPNATTMFTTDGIVETSGGDGHTCAVQPDGTATGQTLWCWGDNTDDVLGAGTGLGAYVTTPVQVTALGNTVRDYYYALAVGVHHTCAIKQDQTLWCWGHNEHGQLGDGTTTNQPLPVQVSALGTGVQVVTVSRGGAFTCASTSTQVYCWGQNDRGQIGDGTTTERHLPTPVTGLTVGAPELRAGNDYACQGVSLHNLCWGANDHGQLGDGTTTERHTPVSFLMTAVAPPEVPGSNDASLGAAAAALALLGLVVLGRKRATRSRA
jgi:alpha-tubulin suppressor-like RCC1 family protein